MLAPELKQDQGNFGSSDPAQRLMLAEVTEAEILPSFPILCYDRPLSDMKRKPFESGDPTRSGALPPCAQGSSETIAVLVANAESSHSTPGG
jgi:hypothetical protein